MDIKANAYIQSSRVASEVLHCLVVIEEVIVSHTYCMLLAAQDWFCHVSLLVFSVPGGTKILLSCGKQIGYAGMRSVGVELTAFSCYSAATKIRLAPLQISSLNSSVKACAIFFFSFSVPSWILSTHTCFKIYIRLGPNDLQPKKLTAD